MSDYDYGLQNGLWGRDGIPYGLNSYKNDYENKSSIRPYNRSEQKAIRNGFKEVADDKAYNGRYFIKDGLKWIHNISSLKKMLHVSNDEQLFNMGYDVYTYSHAA